MQGKGLLRPKIYARPRAIFTFYKVTFCPLHFSEAQHGDRKGKETFPEPQKTVLILDTETIKPLSPCTNSIRMPMVKCWSREATTLTQTIPGQGSRRSSNI